MASLSHPTPPAAAPAPTARTNAPSRVVSAPVARKAGLVAKDRQPDASEPLPRHRALAIRSSHEPTATARLLLLVGRRICDRSLLTATGCRGDLASIIVGCPATHVSPLPSCFASRVCCSAPVPMLRNFDLLIGASRRAPVLLTRRRCEGSTMLRSDDGALDDGGGACCVTGT